MPLVIFQLKSRIDKKTKTNIIKSSVMEQTMPSEDTGTGRWKTMVYRNQGKGSLKLTDFLRFLKIFLKVPGVPKIRYRCFQLRFQISVKEFSATILAKQCWNPSEFNLLLQKLAKKHYRPTTAKIAMALETSIHNNSKERWRWQGCGGSKHLAKIKHNHF